MVIERSVEVEAPAQRVWEILSDLPRMGELSPENAGGRWVGGASGPVVGARFVGRNQNGWRRWSTQVTVVESEPARSFAFDVVGMKVLPVARWAYAIEPTATGCRVTESFADRRGTVLNVVGRYALGVADREAHNAAGMEETLRRLKAKAESAT